MGTFIHDTTRFSSANALYLGRAALLAYRSKSAIQQEVTALGLDRFRFVSESETQAFVAGDGQKIIVAFRGTEPDKLKDWMTDARVAKGSGPYGRVHKGFKRALRDVWPAVTDAVAKFQDGAQSLWFTGHSLGAALATLAVANLRSEAKPVYGLYTFGQPRVGDSAFQQLFDLDFKAMCFRYANNNDVVTRVPLRSMGYRHVGTCLYFDSEGVVRSDPSFWWKFLDSMEGRMEDLGELGPDSVKDHSMETYARLLEKNLDTQLNI